MKTNSIVPILLAVTSLHLAGCVVARSSTKEESGRKIGESTLSQLEVDVTSQDWVLSVLGEPTRRSTVDDGTEIWIYEHSLKEESRVGVIVLLSSETKNVQSQTVYLEFKDRILTRYWTEGK